MNSKDYTHCDKTGFERGDMGKGKPKAKRVYKLVRVETVQGVEYAHVCSYDVYGVRYDEVLRLDTIERFDQ